MKAHWVWPTICLLASGGCGNDPPAEPAETAPSVTTPRALSSGLSRQEQSDFYHLPEGGALIPVMILGALEMGDPPRTFLEAPERFGFLQDTVTDPADNAYGLPIGMTIETVGGVDIAGLNCAACHTGELRYRGHVLRIDGGPTMSDPLRYQTDILEALDQTLRDGPRRRRFERRIFQWHRQHHVSSLNAEAVGVLVDGLQSLVDNVLESTPGEIADAIGRQASEAADFARETLDTVRETIALAQSVRRGFRSQAQIFAAADPPFGYGRADAMGMARNLLYGPSDESNIRRADGAVSFPHLWGMQYGAWLHWQANINGVMERNIAQSLGTGALLAEATDGELINTVNFESLHRLEQLAYKIEAPSWPEDIFGVVDQDAASRGEALYADLCATCHEEPHEVTPEGLRIYKLYSLAEVGTDPNTAHNVEAPVRIDGEDVPLPDAAGQLFTTLKEQYFEENNVPQATRDEWEQRALRPRSRFPKGMRSTLLESELWDDSRGGKVYPAKPLAGIWATAPYLHNGSVPTLHHLLLPTRERPRRFPVGQLEYDPEWLGYQIDLSQVPARPGIPPFVFDVARSGNSNAGHEYGTELSETERRELLEYLKVLSAPSP